jgi:hypothetical protein
MSGSSQADRLVPVLGVVLGQAADSLILSVLTGLNLGVDYELRK